MNFLFFSYKKLSYFILLSFFIIVAAALYYSTFRLVNGSTPTIFTFSNAIKTYKALNLDTDGNGRRDTINIKINNVKREYTIEIINDNGSKHILMPDPTAKIEGPYIPWWPLQITVADINRDNMPEIIAQVPRTTRELSSYIYRWDGKEYSVVLSGLWNGISLYDLNSDSIPEIIAEEGTSGTGYKYTTYTWTDNLYSRKSMKIDSSTIGHSKISAITYLMNLPYDEKSYDAKSLEPYFTDRWLSINRNIEKLKTFMKSTNGGQMLDYISEETALNSQNNTKSSIWKIRYIVFKKSGNQDTALNYTLDIETEGTESNIRIKNINIKEQ